MGKRGLIVFSLVIILSLSVISAFSFLEDWNKITGKATSSTGNCADSDGGANFSIKGKTTYPGFDAEDSCIDENTLQEFYCFDYKGESVLAELEEKCGGSFSPKESLKMLEQQKNNPPARDKWRKMPQLVTVPYIKRGMVLTVVKDGSYQSLDIKD